MLVLFLLFKQPVGADAHIGPILPGAGRADVGIGPYGMRSPNPDLNETKTFNYSFSTRNYFDNLKQALPRERQRLLDYYRSNSFKSRILTASALPE